MSSSYLAVGYECNHKCICCPLTTYDRLHDRLSLAEIEKRLQLINVNDDGNGRHLILSGGEPMLHPQFLQILEQTFQQGFRVTVLSNSSVCRSQDFVSRLLHTAPNGRLDVVTAIHSSYPEIHDTITGMKGSLLETLEGLDMLLSAGIPITIKHIFNRISIGTLPETIHYLNEHFPPKVAFQFCTMDYCGRAYKNAHKLFITPKEIQPVLEQVLDYLEDNMSIHRRVLISEAPLCLTDPYYWKYYNISSSCLDGYIAPNTDGQDIFLQVQSDCGPYYDTCKICGVSSICPGTWKSAVEYFGQDLLQPITVESVNNK